MATPAAAWGRRGRGKGVRGRDTTERSEATRPEESWCRRPPADRPGRWAGNAWPSTRANSHLLAAMPPGACPGVDETEVYSFLQAHAQRFGRPPQVLNMPAEARDQGDQLRHRRILGRTSSRYAEKDRARTSGSTLPKA